MKLKNIFIAGAMAIALGSTAQAEVAVPNTFTTGSPAVAADVNENFSVLATAINDLAARVEALEAAPGLSSGVPVAGRYSLISTGTQFYRTGTYVELEDRLMRGRLEIYTDNTWLLTGGDETQNRAVEFLHYMTDIGGTTSTSVDTEDGYPLYFRATGTWDRDASLLTLTLNQYISTDAMGNVVETMEDDGVVEMRISQGSLVLLGSERNVDTTDGIEHTTGINIAIRTGDLPE